MSHQVICAGCRSILLTSLWYIVDVYVGYFTFKLHVMYAGTMWVDIMSLATMVLLFAITVLMTFYEGCYAFALYFGFPNE